MQKDKCLDGRFDGMSFVKSEDYFFVFLGR